MDFATSIVCESVKSAFRTAPGGNEVRFLVRGSTPGPRQPALATAILAVLLAIGQPAFAQSFSTETGTASFTSSVPFHSFTGTSDHLTGRISLADSTVDFFVDLETLDTGIGKRDKDMRETLETDEYPFAEFFGKLVTPFKSDSEGAQAVRAEGTFTVHGVTREIAVDGTLQYADGALRLVAHWELNLKDYDIEPPRLLIVKVDEIQKIRIEATLNEHSGTSRP